MYTLRFLLPGARPARYSRDSPAVAGALAKESKAMLSRISMYGAVLACAVLLLASLPASADEKKGDKPALSGTWGKKDGEMKLEFGDKGALKIAPHGNSNVIAIVCDYTVAKDGIIKVKVTGFEGKEDVKKKIADVVPVGLKFSFKWTVTGETAKLADVEGDKAETLKSHLEGDFEQKK
jgi:hypothetical protein